jgi:hypothetical protein
LELLEDLQRLFAVVLSGLGIITIIVGVILKFRTWPYIKDYIDQRTNQIQSNSNGGKSLPDIALMLGELKGQIGTLIHRIEVIEENTAIKRRKK